MASLAGAQRAHATSKPPKVQVGRLVGHLDRIVGHMLYIAVQ
jgi:hypothetical protein